jgi:hypothetical protein
LLRAPRINLGDKLTLSTLISEITQIPEDVVRSPSALSFASVANRMSWASERQTTRIEDVAYSLLGIFNVNMPLLYGEGKKAFIRLQEEILKESDDQSIFAWVSEEATDPKGLQFQGVLADSPSRFASLGNIIPIPSRPERQPYSMTNRASVLSFHFGTQL